MAALAGVDPWGRYQLSDLVAMARARNDMQWQHEVALINLLGNALSSKPRPVSDLKPGKGL